ncbi:MULTISPECIES: hypothetical protein [unclassified Bradyrhizobium]|uniref:hypothetical protein n=1 Tax=unclassified Bradyrhizobium TaxID=2631580 RepID=UPI002916C181|nr:MULTISPECIES: hypothetical protein [unclassified Bradyrhizobium]
MSEQAEQTSAGAVVTEPAASPTSPAQPTMTDATGPAAHMLVSPRIAPDHEAPTADAAKAEVKTEVKPEAKLDIRPDAAPAEIAKPEAAKIDARVETITPAAGAAKPTLTILDLTKPEPRKVEPAKIELIKAEAPTNEPPKADVPKLSALGVTAPKIAATNAAPPKLDAPAKRLIMSSANDGGAGETAASVAARVAAAAKARLKLEPFKFDGSDKTAAASAAAAPKPEKEKPEQETPAAFVLAGRRGTPALAAMLLVAVLAGGIGGAFATMAFLHGSTAQPTAAATENDPALSASVARIDSDVATLKAGLEQANQTSLVELNKAAERLDKLEKAQGELAAKVAKPTELQKLSDAVERLRSAQASAAAQATAKETTNSIAPAHVASVAPAAPVETAAPKPDVSKPKIVEGWVLRNVGRGGALIEGRDGLYEVYAGDPVPGLGKIDAIRRQDGRWVVVTSRGLVVSR